MASGLIKILFVIADLEGYGAQRMLVNLISHIDRKIFSPFLVLSKKEGLYLDELPKDIRIYDLGRKSIYDFPKLVLKLAAIIGNERPQIIFSILFHANILALLVKIISRFSGKVIISEQISQKGYRFIRYGFFYRWLMRRLYAKAHLIVAVSGGVKTDLVRIVGIPPVRIKVIYNPLDLEKMTRLSSEAVNNMPDSQYPVIISVGRIDRQKGYPYLLQAFSIVRDSLPSKLMIIGDGEDREELQNIARELGVEKDVFFAGYQNNPYKYLSRATVFVNSSLYEGFAYVIVEAMAVGLPVVATACPHGPDEIIQDEKNGLLVPPADARAIAEAIIKLLKDKDLRMRLSFEARRRAEDFSINKIVREYEKMFLEVVEVE